MRVSDPSLLGPEFGRNGKEAITVRNLLLHNAGFPPDPNPNYCKLEMRVVKTSMSFSSTYVRIVYCTAESMIGRSCLLQVKLTDSTFSPEKDKNMCFQDGHVHWQTC